jgi:hypothetical protein
MRRRGRRGVLDLDDETWEPERALPSSPSRKLTLPTGMIRQVLETAARFYRAELKDLVAAIPTGGGRVRKDARERYDLLARLVLDIRDVLTLEEIGQAIGRSRKVVLMLERRAKELDAFPACRRHAEWKLDCPACLKLRVEVCEREQAARGPLGEEGLRLIPEVRQLRLANAKPELRPPRETAPPEVVIARLASLRAAS